MWSYSLALIGCIGLYLAGKKSKWGWAVGFGVQFLWIAFAIVTAQYGFIISAVAYGFFYAKNFLNWHKAKKEELV